MISHPLFHFEQDIPNIRFISSEIDQEDKEGGETEWNFHQNSSEGLEWIFRGSQNISPGMVTIDFVNICLHVINFHFFVFIVFPADERTRKKGR